jgi:hypothetical protein
VTYTVTVTAALNPAKAITVFNIISQSATGVINETAKTIAVTVPSGTPVTSLTTYITHTGASISPLSGVPQNFSSSVDYIVTAEDGSTETYTVTVSSVLNNVMDIAAWIADAVAEDPIAGSDTDHAIPLPLDINLAGTGWTDLLNAIAAASPPKYVSLDLSACTMTGMTGTSGEFDPDYTNSTGKNMIVSLTLPAEAASIKAGIDLSNAAFKHFGVLKSVSGANLANIGQFAFSNCTALTSVSLPEATTIDYGAFALCTSLTTVTLPKVTTINNSAAFVSCTALTTVTLQVAQFIGSTTFSGCTALTTVTIGSGCNINAANSFPNGFKASYDGNSKLPGVYTWNSSTWDYAP